MYQTKPEDDHHEDGDNFLAPRPNEIPADEDEFLRKIFIGGLKYEVTEEILRESMGPYGPVESAEVITDRITQHSRGFGFVIFQNARDAENILKNQPVLVSGQKVDLRPAQPKTPKHLVGGRDPPPSQSDWAAEGRTGKVFVGGLSPETTAEHLETYFSNCGTVMSVEIMYNRQTNAPRGFAFLTFDRYADAARAVGRHPQMGRSVEVKLAVPKMVPRDAPPEIYPPIYDHYDRAPYAPSPRASHYPPHRGHYDEGGPYSRPPPSLSSNLMQNVVIERMEAYGRYDYGMPAHRPPYLDHWPEPHPPRPHRASVGPPPSHYRDDVWQGRGPMTQPSAGPGTGYGHRAQHAPIQHAPYDYKYDYSSPPPGGSQRGVRPSGY